jgi:frataxin-like iron-binding protein CyaY
MSESMVIAVPMLNSTTGIFGCSVSKDEKKTVPPSNETRPVAVAQTGESISSKDVMQLSFQKNKDIIWNSQSTPEQISDAIDLVCESGGDAEQIKGLLMDIAKGHLNDAIRNKALEILQSSYPQDTDVMQLSFQKNKDIIWNSQSTPEQISDAIDLVCESGGDAEQIKGLLMDIAKGERVIRTIRNKAFKILKSSYPQDKDAMQLLKEIDRKDQAEANRILIYLHNRQDGAVKNPFNGFQR